MDPLTAAFAAVVFAYWVMRNSAEAAYTAAREQAEAEARQAASAIRDDLRERRKAWADELNRKLADGRAGGPSTALWWGWAAARTAGAIRRALRREPLSGERSRAIRDKTGPFRRIWDAGRNGARFARDEARRQRQANEERAKVPVGICRRCGAVVAKKAMVWALTRRGTQERMCAKCRDEVTAQRQTDEESTNEPAPRPDDVADAEVVSDRPEIRGPRPEIEAPSPKPAGPAPDPQPVPELPPAPPEPKPELKPEPAGAPAVDPNSTPAIEGAPVPPRSPGQIVPGRAPVPVAQAVLRARANGGGSQTHGQWERATADLDALLTEIGPMLDLMLRDLNAVDAGRNQVQGVLRFNDRTLALIDKVRVMLRESNRRAHPVIQAVEDAGGPDQIAAPPYYAEI